MFYECEVSDTEKHVYDTKSYTGAPDTDTAVSKLQSTSDKLLLNYFFEAPLRKKKTLLGVLIGSELRFYEYISVTCTKVSRKLNALSRITNLMSYEKRRLIMKAFIKSPFNYCTLIRMFHSRNLHNKNNSVFQLKFLNALSPSIISDVFYLN